MKISKNTHIGKRDVLLLFREDFVNKARRMKKNVEYYIGRRKFINHIPTSMKKYHYENVS